MLKMLAIAIVLVLGVTSALEDCPVDCPPSCTNTWTPYPNSQVQGLTLYDDYKTEEDCKAGCIATPDCWSVDWNFVDVECWFGNVQNPTPRDPDESANHYDLTRDCVENCDYRYSWTKYPNYQVLFLAKQPDITSEDDCMSACIQTKSCHNFDWNFDENSCWFGNATNPTPRLKDPTVNHYDIARQCV